MALTTDDQIEIDVRDDAAAMTRLFTLPAPARLDALAEMRGISTFDEGAMSFLKQIHEKGDGFRVHVDDSRFAPALQRLIDADAWGQLRRELARAWEYQRSVLPGIRHPDKVEVILTLGNPADPVFIEKTLGYYGMGATPGSIWIVAWPTDYNVTRIGACGVHELAHNLRTPNIDTGFNLAEWVIHEASPRSSQSKSAARVRRGPGMRTSPVPSWMSPLTKSSEHSAREVRSATGARTSSATRSRNGWACAQPVCRTWAVTQWVAGSWSATCRPPA